MDKFWNIVKPTIYAPNTCECSGYDFEQFVPIYGPHVTMKPDPTGHAPRYAKSGGWLVAECECGWRDLHFNYPEHLSSVSDGLVPVYS